MTRRGATPVYLEVGTTRVFASALEWPGWCRVGRDEEAALAALADYLPRFAPVARRAGLEFPATAADTFTVTERVPGTGTTDFGVPERPATGDDRPILAVEAARQAAVVAAGWAVFDDIAAATPAGLRKGPRGGGRDRDKMVDHVIGAETMYARKLGIRHRQPALGDTAAVQALRAAITEVLARPGPGTPVERGWPVRYAARRIAWHVLDHAWEMQDRTE